MERYNDRTEECPHAYVTPMPGFDHSDDGPLPPAGTAHRHTSTIEVSERAEVESEHAAETCGYDGRSILAIGPVPVDGMLPDRTQEVQCVERLHEVYHEEGTYRNDKGASTGEPGPGTHVNREVDHARQTRYGKPANDRLDARCPTRRLLEASARGCGDNRRKGGNYMEKGKGSGIAGTIYDILERRHGRLPQGVSGGQTREGHGLRGNLENTGVLEDVKVHQPHVGTEVPAEGCTTNTGGSGLPGVYPLDILGAHHGGDAEEVSGVETGRGGSDGVHGGLGRTMGASRYSTNLFHHNHGCPSTQTLFGLKGKHLDWKVHAKNVGILSRNDFRATSVETCVDVEAVRNWNNQEMWLTNADKRYSIVADYADKHWCDPFPRAVADITEEQFDTFTKVGFLAAIKGPETVRARCRVFLNPEHIDDVEKRRLRGITHGFDMNNAYWDGVGYLKLMSLKDTIQSVHDGEIAVCLDHSSFFSQFELEQEVMLHFCFKFKGDWYCWTRLPMGVRPACHVAQAALEILAHKPRELSVVRTYIDNIKFANKECQREDLKKAVKTYLSNCEACNSTINGIEFDEDRKLPTNTDEWIDGLISHKQEFLGVALDHKEKTVALAHKSLKKITRVHKECMDTPLTSRQFSAIMSLLLYTHQILQYNIAAFGAALQQWRQVHHDRQADNKWDDAIPVNTLCRSQIKQWAALGMANIPRKVPLSKEPTMAYLITDASANGWSGILVLPATGEINHVSGLWPERVVHSADAEPVAVLMALMALVPGDFSGSIRVCSDNTGTVYSFLRGYATSYTLNAVLAACQSYAPRAKFDAIHVPGARNPADEGSRGGTIDATKLFVFLHEILGIERVVWNIHELMNGCGPPDAAAPDSAVHVTRSPQHPTDIGTL